MSRDDHGSPQLHRSVLGFSEVGVKDVAMDADEIRDWWTRLSSDQQAEVGSAATADRMDSETLRVMRDTGAPLPHLGDESVCHTTWAFAGPARREIETLARRQIDQTVL